MPVTSETITLAGSGLVFNNTYDPSVTDAYRASIVTAETFLQSHFSDAVTLSGGAGADTFHTFSGAGTDIVLDFNAAEGDRVQVDAGTTYTVSQQGADVVVDMGGGDELILKNVQLSSLPANWIFTL